MTETKVVAIAESFNKETGCNDFIQCLGIFDTWQEAYGEAMIYLSEISNGSDYKGNIITPLFDLEGDEGYVTYLNDKDGNTTDAVFFMEGEISEKKMTSTHL